MEMIREAENFAVGTLPAPIRPAPMPIAPTTAPAPVMPADTETVEQEITRLTWSVLDGSGSLTDRQRLAELVNAQHARRLRIESL